MNYQFIIFTNLTTIRHRNLSDFQNKDDFFVEFGSTQKSRLGRGEL